MTTQNSVGKLIASLVTCLIPGYVALYIFTLSIPRWYSGLKKPDLVPSDLIVFYAIILVFSLLGLTLYTIWNAGLAVHDVRTTLMVFLFSLILFLLWFVVFFYIQAVFFGLIMMVMVIAAILCTLVLVLRSTVSAAFFLIPCLILMLIFCYANLQILIINPGLSLWGSFL
jgi:translocator protein